MWGKGEWDDGVELSLTSWSGSKNGMGFIRMKYDYSSFYAIIDFTSVSTIIKLPYQEGASITFDTKNDGGNKSKTDDYRFDIFYTGQGSMQRGTGSGFEWGLPLPEGVLLGASMSSSPHSSKNHLIYEFRIPLSIFPRASTMGFAAGAYHGTESQFSQMVLLTWPADYYLDVPSTWGKIDFPTPVPEFPSTIILAAVALVLTVLITTKAKSLLPSSINKLQTTSPTERRMRQRYCSPTVQPAQVRTF
jgi:hypothetical protein